MAADITPENADLGGAVAATIDDPGETNAYELIRASIVENRYVPGQRLVEQRLAEDFGLSRTPVREALRQLAAEGLVIMQRNRGARVRPMSTTEVADLYGLRIRLESYAAELAAERATAEEIEELELAVKTFSRARRELVADTNLDALRRVNQANEEIHSRIVVAARHDRLSAMLSRTVDIPLVFRAFRVFGSEELGRSDDFHRLILDAIRRQDGARAARLMAEHIHQGLDAVLDTFDADGIQVDGVGRSQDGKNEEIAR